MMAEHISDKAKKAMAAYIKDLNARMKWARFTMFVEADMYCYRVVVEPYSVPIDDVHVEGGKKGNG